MSFSATSNWPFIFFLRQHCHPRPLAGCHGSPPQAHPGLNKGNISHYWQGLDETHSEAGPER